MSTKPFDWSAVGGVAKPTDAADAASDPLKETAERFKAQNPFSRFEGRGLASTTARVAGQQAGEVAQTGVGMAFMNDILDLAGAARNLPSATEIAKAALNPKTYTEKLNYARDLVGKSMRDAIQAVKSRAAATGGKLFESAMEKIDSAAPGGVTDTVSLATKIEKQIADETAGMPELEDRVKSMLPKEVRKLLAGEPSELEQASVYRGRKVGFTGKSVTQALEFADRLTTQGLSPADVRSVLLNQGFSARDIDTAMNPAARKELGSAISAKRLNEIQREIGEKAFGNYSPESRVMKGIYHAIGGTLDQAAAKAGPEALQDWLKANAGWSHYIQAFREGPMARALESETGSQTAKAIGGEYQPIVAQHLKPYALAGDENYQKAIEGMRKLSHLDALEKMRWFVERRAPYALLWPVMELMRGQGEKAGKEAVGVGAGELAADKLLKWLALRGMEVPKVIP